MKDLGYMIEIKLESLMRAITSAEDVEDMAWVTPAGTICVPMQISWSAVAAIYAYNFDTDEVHEIYHDNAHNLLLADTKQKVKTHNQGDVGPGTAAIVKKCVAIKQAGPEGTLWICSQTHVNRVGMSRCIWCNCRYNFEF